ncbi:transcription factor e(y)2-domain-containing protein [Lipomyces arxii]|uniref:transcription factor e(y)2-domain-containing protein n=1 Tax=Lipomyces arxii TaxID=56418 RepID=UPI0034CE6224
MADSKVKAKIHQKLVESGEYERISTLLRQKLIETGWYEQVRELATERMRAQESSNFDKLVDDVELSALSLVSDEVKIEILNMIKTFLEGIAD